MSNEKELVHALRDAWTIKGRLVSDLEYLKSCMVDLSESVNVAKTIGTSVGAVGTVAAVGGIVLAFFTAGASLALTATAIGGGVVGGATNITTSIVEHKKYKSYMNRIELLVRKYAEEEGKVSKIVENYCRDVCQAAKDCGLDLDSFLHAVNKMATTGVKLVSFSTTTLKNIELMRKASTISTLLKYGRITGSMGRSGASFGFQAASVEAYAALLANEANAMKTVMEYGTTLSASSKATSKLLFGAALSVVQVGFTAYEIVDLVKGWSTKHPAIEAVEDLIRKIKADVKKLDELIKRLDC